MHLHCMASVSAAAIGLRPGPPMRWLQNVALQQWIPRNSRFAVPCIVCFKADLLTVACSSVTLIGTVGHCNSECIHAGAMF